jgi:hypothetical protein
MLRKVGERTVSGLWALIGKLVDLFRPTSAPTTSAHAVMIQTDQNPL